MWTPTGGHCVNSWTLSATSGCLQDGPRGSQNRSRRDPRRLLGSSFDSSWGPFWGLLGASWGPLWGLLGASWGLLGASWGPLEASWGLLEDKRLETSVRVPRLGPLLEPSWKPFGPSWGPHGPYWGSLGPSGGHLGRLGALWGRLGSLLGRLGSFLDRSGPVPAQFGVQNGIQTPSEYARLIPGAPGKSQELP